MEFSLVRFKNMKKITSAYDRESAWMVDWFSFNR